MGNLNLGSQLCTGAPITKMRASRSSNLFWLGDTWIYGPPMCQSKVRQKHCFGAQGTHSCIKKIDALHVAQTSCYSAHYLQHFTRNMLAWHFWWFLCNTWGHNLNLYKHYNIKEFQTTWILCPHKGPTSSTLLCLGIQGLESWGLGL